MQVHISSFICLVSKYQDPPAIEVMAIATLPFHIKESTGEQF